MSTTILWALLILFIEFRKLSKNFQTPIEKQDDERKQVLDYIYQMKDYLGLKTFKIITILSSIVNNGIYIAYFLSSIIAIEYEPYQILCGFFFVDRVFKIFEFFELDINKMNFIIGSDVVIGIRSIVVIVHVFVTLLVLIINPF